MKKAFGVILSLVLIMGMVFSVPLSASAITIEEMDADDTVSAFFDFEDKDFMLVGSQSQESKKVVWQIDAVTSLEYHYSGWGFSSIGDNPVTGDTGVAGSVVNSSAKVLQAKKPNYNGWATGGGIVINRKTEKGIEPLILENNTTYTVEFDYIVVSTHKSGAYTDPNDATNSGTISESATSSMSFGYGYKTTNSAQMAPVQGPAKTVATFAEYSAKTVSEYGKYKTKDGNGNIVEKPVGSWYHQSYTFTTGTFDTIYSTTNAPFLIFYANMYSGTDVKVDNIRVSKHVSVNFHPMGGTISSASDSGKVGDTIDFPTAERYGYEFTGWYTDGSYSEKFVGNTFTKANAGSTAFAGWTQDICSFESYAAASSSANGGKFSVSNEHAYSGSKSMKYSYSKTFLGLDREKENNYFTIRTLDKAGKYKLTFKYYIVSGGQDITVYPVLTGISNSATEPNLTITPSDNTLTGAGKWQTASIVFTTASTINSSANNLSLHVHANSNANTTAYIDDIKVMPLFRETENGVITNDSGSLTINGATTRTVGLSVGDTIDSAFVYNGGYALEGYYKDPALTDKVPANIYKTGINAVYPKFGDRVDLTADGEASRTDGFAKANYEDALYYNGNGGTAGLAQVTSGKTYMVEFLYKNTGDHNVTLNFTNASGSFTAQSGKSDKWYKGFIPATASSTDILTLNATGNSSLEIKEVYIKDLSDKVYIIFDSTEYGGELTAVYGTQGSAIDFPANPIVSGKKFVGWYNGSSKFTSTVFPSSSVSLTARMVLAGGTAQGDCDGDGACDSSDLAKMKLYLAKVDIQITEGADMNGDGKINAIDLVLLHNKLSV